MQRPLILVTNDDGVAAPGIVALAAALDEVGEVWVYAPDRERSAVGHGISLHRPLRMTKMSDRVFAVDGTPTDCVLLAVRDGVKPRPSLVVSGINHGCNLGDDVTYSGTVAGAFEGMLLNIPSFSISKQNWEAKHMETAARFAVVLARNVLERGLPKDTMLNVNVPDCAYDDIAGIRITRMGKREYDEDIVTRVDPRGRNYHWLGAAESKHIVEPGTDIEALEAGYVSVTPLQRNLTNIEALPVLEGWALEK